jgi:hypothetical protein
MAKSLEERLIDRMYELEETYRVTLEQRATNRRSLRDLLTQGMLSEEQAIAVEEHYPERAPRGSRLTAEVA